MILVAANPYSGAGRNRRRVDLLVGALRALGADTRVLWQPEETAAVLGQATDGGCRAVVAAGGDGTVAAVVNALPPGVPLAVLPLGNENLLAGALGLSREPAALARAIVACRTRVIDLGRASAAGRSRLFTLMLGAGFDAAVVHRVAAWRTTAGGLRRVRRASYIARIAACCVSYPYAPLELATDTAAARGVQCVIANVPGYALGVRLTPTATPDDGRLDWLVLERSGLASLLAYCWTAYRGRHLERADVRAGQATRLRVTAATPTPVQLDGDAWGTTPVDVEVVPRALTLIETR